jgi:ribosomal protein S18 acetylase RimI-like enzyme
LDNQIALRPATPGDDAFLRAVYASTRSDELAVTDWSEEQKAAFCTQQFTAQAAHYRAHYPTAEYNVIEFEQQPAGRLYLDRWTREIRIMDIALLPAFRGRGIGSYLLEQLKEEARAVGKLLSIHVEKFNPALRLYQRHGFTQREDKGVYLLMEWVPGTTS